jgi:hypothetical protein
MESIFCLLFVLTSGGVLKYFRRPLSFGELNKFKEKIQQMSQGGTLKIVIAGNKCDTTEQGRARCQELGHPFFECSAKANIQIAPIFEASLKQLLGVADGPENGAKKDAGDGGGCCSVA